MVESPTRPWSSLSCFEATPSIQVYPVTHMPKASCPGTARRGDQIQEPAIRTCVAWPRRRSQQQASISEHMHNDIKDMSVCEREFTKSAVMCIILLLHSRGMAVSIFTLGYLDSLEGQNTSVTPVGCMLRRFKLITFQALQVYTQ